MSNVSPLSEISGLSFDFLFVSPLVLLPSPLAFSVLSFFCQWLFSWKISNIFHKVLGFFEWLLWAASRWGDQADSKPVIRFLTSCQWHGVTSVPPNSVSALKNKNKSSSNIPQISPQEMMTRHFPMGTHYGFWTRKHTRYRTNFRNNFSPPPPPPPRLLFTVSQRNFVSIFCWTPPPPQPLFLFWVCMCVTHLTWQNVNVWWSVLGWWLSVLHSENLKCCDFLWGSKCHMINVEHCKCCSLSLTCARYFQWPWPFCSSHSIAQWFSNTPPPPPPHQFFKVFYLMIKLKLCMMIMNDRYTTIFDFHIPWTLKGCKRHISWCDRNCNISFFLDVVSVFKAALWPVWGPKICTRFDDHDLVSRPQVCQEHTLQTVGFRFFSTIVQMLYDC